MRRVLVLGCAGAGKTRLARHMAAILELPVVHLDRHYWDANWTEPDSALWADHVAGLVAASAWIMDGNYGGTLPLRLMAADTVIYLDFPAWLCLARVLGRTLRWFGRTRGGDMTPGCPERFDPLFLRYICGYRRKHRPRIMASFSNFGGTLIVLKRPVEVRECLADLPRYAD